MSHRDILNNLKKLFPGLSIVNWWRKGSDSIRVRVVIVEGMNSNTEDLIFTYVSSKEWKLESMKMYGKSIDGI